MTRCTSQQRNLINHVWRKDFYPIKKKTKGGVGLVIRQQVLKEGQNGAPGQRGRWQGKAGHRPGAHLPGAPSGSGSWHPNSAVSTPSLFQKSQSGEFLFCPQSPLLRRLPTPAPQVGQNLWYQPHAWWRQSNPKQAWFRGSSLSRARHDMKPFLRHAD